MAKKEEIGLTAAVEEAMKAKGVNALRRDLRAWILEKHPSLASKMNNFGTAVKTVGDKLGRTLVERGKGKSAPASNELTITELLELKEHLDKMDDKGELLDAIKQVQTLAKLVGSVDNLFKGVETLSKLQGK